MGAARGLTAAALLKMEADDALGADKSGSGALTAAGEVILGCGSNGTANRLKGLRSQCAPG